MINGSPVSPPPPRWGPWPKPPGWRHVQASPAAAAAAGGDVARGLAVVVARLLRPAPPWAGVSGLGTLIMGPLPLCSWAGFSGGSICPSPGSWVRLPLPAGSPEALPKPAGSETSSSRRVPPAAPPPAAAAVAAPLGAVSYTAGATVARLTPQAESGPRTDGLAPPLAGPVAGGGPDAAGCCGLLLFFSSWWWLSNRRPGSRTNRWPEGKATLEECQRY